MTAEPPVSLLDHFNCDEPNLDRKPIEIKGRVMTISCNRFWINVVPTLPVNCADTRALRHFIHLRILPQWVCDAAKPILHYSQREIVLLVEGLEWHAGSDIYFRNRTPVWQKQVFQLMELCMLRCVYFFRLGECPVDVLDSDEHRDVNSTFGKIEFATVNYAYLFEMETLMTGTFVSCYESRHPIPLGPPVHIDRVRSFVFGYAEKMGEPDIRRTRRDYYHELIVTPAQRAVHYHRVPFDINPSLRTILAYKHEAIAGDAVTSKDEILGQKSGIDAMISMDSMFTFYCRSLKRKSGDPLHALRDLPGYPKVHFNRLHALWVLEIDPHTIIGYYSLVELYVFMRTTYPDLTLKGPIKLDIIPT